MAVPDPEPDAAARAACAALLDALPEVVLERSRRPTEPGGLTAAWGDPPIALRCGVLAPPGLTPISPCVEVDGVGWFAEEASGGRLFTTIGRSAYVEVGVPSAYAPEAGALVDLAPAVTAAVPSQRPCR